MKFVIGIGNPGKSYDKTRHNVGFAVLDRLKDSGIKKTEAMFVKPETFVNRTGEAVAALLKKYPKATAQDFLIVCDDVNLLFGKMRLRGSGSAGGHHGLESVIEALGGNGFSRLRIGVGQEAMPKDLTGFVLEKFSKSEQKALDEILERAVLVCESWVNEGLEASMNVLSRLQSVKSRESVE